MPRLRMTLTYVGAALFFAHGIFSAIANSAAGELSSPEFRMFLLLPAGISVVLGFGAIAGCRLIKHASPGDHKGDIVVLAVSLLGLLLINSILVAAGAALMIIGLVIGFLRPSKPTISGA